MEEEEINFEIFKIKDTKFTYEGGTSHTDFLETNLIVQDVSLFSHEPKPDWIYQFILKTEHDDKAENVIEAAFEKEELQKTEEKNSFEFKKGETHIKFSFVDEKDAVLFKEKYC